MNRGFFALQRVRKIVGWFILYPYYVVLFLEAKDSTVIQGWLFFNNFLDTPNDPHTIVSVSGLVSNKCVPFSQEDNPNVFDYAQIVTCTKEGVTITCHQKSFFSKFFCSLDDKVKVMKYSDKSCSTLTSVTSYTKLQLADSMKDISVQASDSGSFWETQCQEDQHQLPLPTGTSFAVNM